MMHAIYERITVAGPEIGRAEGWLVLPALEPTKEGVVAGPG